MSLPKFSAYWLLPLTLLVPAAHAKCEITKVSQTERSRAAKLDFGRINLSHPVLHPDGSLLASIMVPPTNYTFGGAHAGSVLWKCDQADIDTGQVHFLVSTNGNSRFGGEFEIGPEGSGIYATWFDHIGLRQTMAGVTLKRQWQIVKLQSWLPVKEKVKKGVFKDRVHIRLMDIPPLQAELYWVEKSVPPSHSYNCRGYPNSPDKEEVRYPGIDYACKEPASYIQLVGPGLDGKHDNAGEDHNHHHWKFFSKDNGFGYTLWNAVTLSRTPTCVVHSEDQHVRFATTRVQALQDGVPAGFSIVLDCSNFALSGSGSGETAIGLQVSPGAFAAAQEQGLVHDGGVEYLLSDQYDTGPGLAKGVGIALYDAEDQQRRFVGQPGRVGIGHPQGPQAGWHPISWGKPHLVGGSTDRTLYQLDFTAKLMQLPGHTATPGKVEAAATVLVKVQ